MNPVQKIKKQIITHAPLLLENKEVPEEVIEYKERLQSYGISNTTVKKINTTIQEKKDKEVENVKQQAINFLIDNFMPFNIVTYKTLDKVCKDHKLVIAGLNHYDKAIPDDNIEELDIFVDRLKNMDRPLCSKISVISNKYFTFANGRYSHSPLFSNIPEHCATTDEMFKIAAPKNHFKIPRGHERIGNEYSSTGVAKPKFNYTFKFHAPSFELDPIIFMPISFAGKIFCVIVTAWDQVADDSRILSKL